MSREGLGIEVSKPKCHVTTLDINSRIGMMEGCTLYSVEMNMQ